MYKKLISLYTVWNFPSLNKGNLWTFYIIGYFNFCEDPFPFNDLYIVIGVIVVYTSLPLVRLFTDTCIS